MSPTRPIRFWGLIEAAGLRDNQDEAAVKQAALKVERVEVRETIYGLLYGIAVEDAIGPRENAILEFLATSWELEIKDVPAEDADAG